ncbi:hypothetical protein MMC30_005862 [Trapelia coarctata]|nr:hypothetical protein [Trapelia coarctata]
MNPPRVAMGRLLAPSNILRPLKVVRRPPNPRLFTQNSQLLLVSSPSPRPQLPFLHNPSALRAPHYLNRNQFQLQLSRLLTTERKRYVKEQVKAAAKVTAYLWTVAALLALVATGYQNERLERAFPSPREWSFGSRWCYRTSRGKEEPEANPNGLTDWAHTGEDYRQILRRLEDPNIDGKDLHPPLGAEGDIYVEGIGKTGFDITAKSEEWRSGYYECLRGAARAAEHLDTWVRDKTRNMAFPPDVVIGPSNPRPRSVPYGSQSAPLEENCEPAFESPEVYYMKILTTQGFNTRQRLEAALAYADWLDFKGLPSSAEDMYDWGLDIATGALPLGIHNVVDTKTGVINELAPLITPNILIATTALAIHHAKNGNLSTALPIFLSILRSQRSLPPLSPTTALKLSPSPSDSDLSTMSILISIVRSIIVSPSYPEPPPSGDTPATRTPTTICEEAATMGHIGEILFASSTSPRIPSSLSSTKATSTQSSGLAWTRSSVDLAEKTLHSLSTSNPSSSSRRQSPTTAVAQSKPSPDTDTARQRCTECLVSSMENWKLMVSKLQNQEREAAERTGSSVLATQRKQKGWFWSSSKDDESEGVEGRWERETKMVEEKAKEVAMLIRQEGWMNEAEAGARGGVLGFA